MLYQIIIAAVLAVFLVNLILNLKNMKKPSIHAKVPQPAPMISVLVPARDEEVNIRACVESLQNQDYPNYEILVLDDNSSDATADIMTELSFRDKRTRLIHGQPLPEDWAGKPFACYQLAREAKGSWLLFVDADTVHEPHMLRSVLALALEQKTSLLSGFPRQLADSFWPRVIIPVFYFILLSWVPMWWLHSLKKPRPSMGIGQFFFFSRDEYWRFGGHEAVKGRLVEDVWMGVEVSRSGGKHVAADLSTVTSCKMYCDLKSAWNGLGKSIYSVAAMMPLALVALIITAFCCYVAPFFFLWNVFNNPAAPLLWRGLIIIQIALILFMRWLVGNRFREPGISLWFHPLGLLFYLLNVFYSFGRWLAGAGTTWKDRFYGKESTVE